MSAMNNTLDASSLRVGRFYRINGIVIYCARYTVSFRGSDGTVRIEGCRPQDYAAYLAHFYIGENKHPYRTVAEIEGIPYPELIEVSTTIHTKVTELNKEEALSECKAARLTQGLPPLRDQLIARLSQEFPSVRIEPLPDIVSKDGFYVVTPGLNLEESEQVTERIRERAKELREYRSDEAQYHPPQ